MGSDSVEIGTITIINDNSVSSVCIFILFNPLSSCYSQMTFKGLGTGSGGLPRPDAWHRHLTGSADVEASRSWSGADLRGPQARYPNRPLPRSLGREKTPATALRLRTRPAPAAQGEDTSPQAAGNVERLHDPHPATRCRLTHHPSSCSDSFTLKLTPQHTTLPAPPLTHFPAEPAPSITPAPPPPPPPHARPKPGAEGACGNCRKDRRKAARGGGRHSCALWGL